MRKNPHNRILKGELKEQYLSNVPKSYLFGFDLKNHSIYLPFIYTIIQEMDLKSHQRKKGEKSNNITL